MSVVGILILIKRSQSKNHQNFHALSLPFRNASHRQLIGFIWIFVTIHFYVICDQSADWKWRCSILKLSTPQRLVAESVSWPSSNCHALIRFMARSLTFTYLSLQDCCFPSRTQNAFKPERQKNCGSECGDLELIQPHFGLRGLWEHAHASADVKTTSGISVFN